MKTLSWQLLRFAFAGTVGFAVDAAVVLALIEWAAADLISAKLLGFAVAVTITWIINRNLTFAAHASHNKLKEWGQYVVANSAGGIANNLAYVIAIFQLAWLAKHPVFAVALGSLVGMVFNFIASRWWVFRKGKPIHG
jgi:putative flippase GtrA